MFNELLALVNDELAYEPEVTALWSAVAALVVAVFAWVYAAFAVLEMAVKSNDGPVGDVTPKDPFELLNTRPPMLIEPEPTKREWNGEASEPK